MNFCYLNQSGQLSRDDGVEFLLRNQTIVVPIGSPDQLVQLLIADAFS
jgi:hypothetical protein